MTCRGNPDLLAIRLLDAKMHKRFAEEFPRNTILPMHRVAFRRAYRPAAKLFPQNQAIFARRALNTRGSEYESKYADKLSQRAKEKGVSISQLKELAKERLEEERARVKEANHRVLSANAKANPAKKGPDSQPLGSSSRQDSSPVKPLSTILNLPRILSGNLNATQVGALWTAYHASRSEGTGRGYLCASIPVDMYEKMAKIGAKYPSFVLPVPRPKQPNAEEVKGEEDMAYEFYFMEWGFHEAPPAPSTTPVDPLSSQSTPPDAPASKMPISTVLFTPLIQYKLRNQFATPYLILTHYTDLAQSHGIVLLRGEITPASGEGRYMLSQEDAQVLSMGLQKFYLWNDKAEDAESSKGEQILRAFHEKQEDFDWQDMLKYGTTTS
ncbi:f1f0 atp synthase assembly protein atp11 [Moniliophthora roreri MCA 2997]|uniref:F1f0 atp synthase assembly protein atp11 n=1 Tax=Moniliophthora roreri (strain MCA 2997) TaxID=1381753 RepID=V2XRP2_MONRO|nr:f1f0 atp synthase assembly protein atp11 [Moniliophthora roreri MCA 2997]